MLLSAPGIGGFFYKLLKVKLSWKKYNKNCKFLSNGAVVTCYFFFFQRITSNTVTSYLLKITLPTLVISSHYSLSITLRIVTYTYDLIV